MPTLYLDFENGNDNHGGTSFALLASGTDGRITTATFSSAGASFPNDGSLIGQYLSIFNGSIYAVYNITAWVSATSLTVAAISGGTALANQAVDRQYFIGGRWKNITTGATAVRTIPGDTIRIMGSPAPTSLGQNGVWTSQALQATKTITGATAATPIAITCSAHGYSTGDTVVITGVGGNTNANGTWEITSTGANTFTLNGSAPNSAYTSGGSARLRNNTCVRLASAVTQNIASTGRRTAAWVASSNVTATLNTATTKEHYVSDSIAIASGFSDGKAAYFSTGLLNLSAYRQVSFWIQQTVGTVGADGQIELKLCSDTTGDNTVNTISVPALASTGRWMPVTVDLGSPPWTDVRSIALYVVNDVGAQTFLLSNIIACKAPSEPDSLTLTSLIGKNTTGETFWGIQSINGTRVMLDADTNGTPTSTIVGGYYGTSETVTTWKRETIKLGPAAAASTALQTIQESGTDGSPIIYSGGWDRTAMSTQDLETWLDGVNGNGVLFVNRSFTIKEKFAAVRLASIGNEAAQCTTSFIAANNSITSAGSPLIGPAGLSTFIVDHIVANNGTAEILCSMSSIGYIYLRYLFLTTGARGIQSDGRMVLAGLTPTSEIRSADGSADQFRIGTSTGSYPGNLIKDIAVNIRISNVVAGDYFLSNVLLSASNEFSAINSGAVFFSHNHDQTVGNHKIFFPSVTSGNGSMGALISSATDQRHTASGISWKIQPTSTNRSSAWPVPLSLAKVACAANSLVTIKAWMRRTNTGLTMRLVCKGGQIAGVTSDVVSAMTAAADTWEELTITFTPTEVGVVEITAEAWGGTTFSGWVDDLTISQS